MKEEDDALPLVFGDQAFAPGEGGEARIPVGQSILRETVPLTLHVRRGRMVGPRLLVTSTLHGDEVNGVEVIRRLLTLPLKLQRGDLIAIPIANPPAFLARGRYLPDRRDLNRLFPGLSKGSFGSILARILTQDVAAKCTHAVDFHTGAAHRPNLPQVRFWRGTKENRSLAQAFGTPVALEATLRDGSFREVFANAGKPMLMFEGGEASVLDPASVWLGVRGVLRVMRHLKMIPEQRESPELPSPVFCSNSWWERAPEGGVFTPAVELGDLVKKGQRLGHIGSPFGGPASPLDSGRAGLVIGRAKNAVVDQGDALFHLAQAAAPAKAEAALARFREILSQTVFDREPG